MPPGDPSTHFVFEKNAFLQTCRSAGIPVPRFELCWSLADAQAAAHSIGYPVVVKLARGYAGTTTFLARDDAVLAEVVSKAHPTEGFAVQKMVDGPIGSTDVLFDRGRPLCRLSSYSGDCAPTAFAPKTARQIIEAPVLERIIDRIGALSAYHGLAGIDWVMDAATGEFFILEISPNPDGGYALTADAEKLFADGIRALLTHDPSFEPQSVRARPGWIPIAPEWSLYYAERATRTSPAMLLRFVQMLTHISWRDPRIAWGQLRTAFRFLVRPARTASGPVAG